MNYKICFFITSLIKGGAENQMLKLAIYLNQKGYEILIISIYKENDFEEILKKFGLKHVLINFSYGLGFFKLLNVIKSNKVDIIISFMFASNIISRFLKFLTGKKLITSVRVNKISLIYRLFYKFTYRIDDLTTFNSKISLEKFLDEKLTDKNKSVLIKNAIDVKNFSRIKTSNKIFKIISIAHFRDQKDYPTLFNSIKILKSKGYKISLNVVGHLHGQNWPIKMIKDLNIENEVILHGFVADSRYLLSNSDVLVLSTKWEGTPNVILEAMASKLPVVCSDVPGCRIIMDEAKCGFTFLPGDSIDLAKKLTEIISMKPKRRDNIAESGYKYVLSEHNHDHVFNFWENKINKILCAE